MYNLTTDTLILFGVFVVVVFLIYKLFRVLMKGLLVAGAGFSFPWVVQYLNLPLSIAANTETAIQFAVIALMLFLFYEFFHFVKYLLKVLVWPFKMMRRKK